MFIKITPSDKQLLPSHLWYVWHTHAKFQYIPLPARDVHHARRDACVVTNDVGRPTSPRHVEQQGHSLPGAMLAQAPLRQNTQPTLSKYLWEVMGCKFIISTISLIHNHRDSKSRVSALISIAKTTHSAFALFGSGKSHHTQTCSFFSYSVWISVGWCTPENMRSDCWWVDPVKLLVSMALFWLRFQHAMPPQVSICTGIDGSTQAHVVGGQAFGMPRGRTRPWKVNGFRSRTDFAMENWDLTMKNGGFTMEKLDTSKHGTSTHKSWSGTSKM